MRWASQIPTCQGFAERLTAKPALAKATPSGRAGPGDIIKARLIAESAKEVSQPDSLAMRHGSTNNEPNL
jgi:hypothetical protein